VDKQNQKDAVKNGAASISDSRASLADMTTFAVSLSTQVCTYCTYKFLLVIQRPRLHKTKAQT
jgi:hypothetical protein